MRNFCTLFVCFIVGLLTTTLTAQTDTPPKKQDSDAHKHETTSDDKTPAEEPAPIVFLVGDDMLQFTSTGLWDKVHPKSNMLDAEFKIPKVGEDKADGRLTIMGAGGGVEANIKRWEDQFVGARETDRTESMVNGQKVHMVDIQGTYMEGMGGPMGPKTKREKYQMLAAIIETQKHGLYFIKLTGPQATLKANKKHFEAMVKSLKIMEAKKDDE